MSVSACISTCNAGFTGPNGGPCTACVAGKYKTTSGSAECTDCGAGTYSTTVGASVCQNLTCSACPANSYHAQGQCVSCINNTVSLPGSLACQCRPGFTGTPDACQACPAGTYKRMAGTSPCRSCQANSMSDAGSALCRCNAGYTAKDGDVCVACVAGTYKNVTGSSACVACAQRRNSVAAATNVTQCICDISYTQVENAALTFDVVYAQACVACDAGKFKPLIGVQECTPCGQNQSSLAASPICSCVAGFTGPDGGPCSECARNTYKDWLGSQACTSCPANSFTPAIRSTLLVNCSCNIGAAGPDGGPCPSCAGGTFKNVTGTSPCLQCSANFYSTNTSGATSCTMCPFGFQSTAVSVSIVDCCDPNTTIVDGLFNALSSNTKARWSTMYVLSVSSSPMVGSAATPSYAWPSYLAADGFSGQPFLRFSKTSGTTGPHKWLMVPGGQLSVDSGLTLVTVVRFTENMRGMMFSMQQGNEHVGFEVLRSNGLQFCVCALNGGHACNNLCTDAAVPTNVWLQVSYTYNPSIPNKQLLKVSYASAGGSTVTLSKTSTVVITSVTSVRKHAFGYSASTDCSGWASFVPRAENLPMCDRANFDVAGFYLLQLLATDSDVAAIMQHIAFNKVTSCLCNAGFGGSGRSDCKSCAAGSYKSEAASVLCTACPVNMFSAEVQAVSNNTCSACPHGSVSIPGESICLCAAGFTGPDGGPCVACEAGKYKNWRNSSVCPVCHSNADSTEGFALCTCNAGYAGTSNAMTDLLQSCGSTENQRCAILGCGNAAVEGASTTKFNDKDFTEPSMGGISCQLQGISPLPIDFGVEKTVTSVIVYIEQGWCWNHFCVCDYTVRVGNTPPGLYPATNNDLLCPAMKPTNSPLVTISGTVLRKFTIDCGKSLRGRYFTLNKEMFTGGAYNYPHELQVIGFKEYTACVACDVGKYKNNTLSNDLCTACPANSYEPDIGATAVTNCTCNTGFDGAAGGPCTGCALGKYKNTNDTTPCVECPGDTYIDVQSSAYCKPCPDLTTSPVGSASIVACICKLGYTGGGGAATLDPLSSLLTTSPAYLMTSAEAWDAANSRFTDLSGNGRHGVLNWGTVSVGSVAGNGAELPIPFAAGPTSTSISWPSASVPSTFTICSITRYSGATKNSILKCSDLDWQHGHINWYGTGYAGGTWYSSGAQPGSQFGQVTPNTNWVAMCARNIGGAPATITNGVRVSEQNAGRGNCQLSINRQSDVSDWQLSKLYVWNRHLSNTEFAEAAARLNSYVTLKMPVCSACPIGKYKDAIGSSGCTSCPPSTFSGSFNATSIDMCSSCQGNSTSLIGSASKDYCQCNTGFIHEGEGCAACPGGTFNPRLAQTACSNCTVGMYSLNFGATSNETCLSCKETEYSPEGSPLCQSCPPNSVAPAGSSRIQDCGCTFGYTGATASQCEQCAPGSFKNITGNWLCESCSANSHSLPGATALTACFCNPGFTGAFGPLCVACALGKYKSVYGSSACIDCPANTYADRTGMTACTACVATSASAVASNSIWNCTCNAGYKGPTYDEVLTHDNFARSCGGMRNSACMTAQSSTLTTQVSAEVYDFVNPAQLANDNSSSTFSMTAYGTNQWWRVDFERRVTVQAVSLLLGSFAIDMLHVHVGDANSSTGNLLCTSVVVNISNSNSVSATCASAVTGRYLYVRNSIASQVMLREVRAAGTEVVTKTWPDWCEKCPVGTYKTVPGTSACTSCPGNRFSTSLAATSISACLSCPANSVSASGSQQCACDVGFSGDASACAACGSDTFKTQVGSSTCAACPANSVIAANASTALMPCTCLSGFEPK